MKRTTLIMLALTVVFSGLGILTAQAAGVPEVDQAQATFTAKLKAPGTTTMCAGEDATNYEFIKGRKWNGNETEVSTPGDTPLTGRLSVIGNLVINLSTGTGAVTGTATLRSAGGAMLFKGSILGVVQVTNPETEVVELRGLVDALLFENNQLSGGHLIANFELKSNAAGDIQGQFGLLAGSHASLDYSAEWNEQAC